MNFVFSVVVLKCVIAFGGVGFRSDCLGDLRVLGFLDSLDWCSVLDLLKFVNCNWSMLFV